MTIDEVFGLREQGLTEEAYEAARTIYINDKSPHATAAMFWTAVDMLRMRVSEGRMEEAGKIYMALERLLNRTKDEKGWMHDAMERCHDLIDKGNKLQHPSEDAPEHLKTGIWGEELAAAFLRQKGYVILERDWRSSHRDIDIIALKDDCTVFVEVKTRRNREFADPLQAVNYSKRKNLRKAINHYIHYRKINNPWRFDVITIVGELGEKIPEINHIEDFRLM